VERRNPITRGLTSRAGVAAERPGSLNVPDQRAIEVQAMSRVALKRGIFDCYVFCEPDQPEKEHVALIRGTVATHDVLVRVHSECLTGEAFDSLHCDCGEQLDQALSRIAVAGCGIVIYLRQEGRGIGLASKLQAYMLQAGGLDTFEANRALGLPEDARSYDAAAAMLAHVGVQSIRLMTNNPDKVSALRALGVDVRQKLAMPVSVNPHNARYLETKRGRAGNGAVSVQDDSSSGAPA
jgi:GTP cyclohydrolase II